MARDDSDSPRDPERKRSSGSAGADARGAARGRAAGAMPRRGRSGYGIESIRPHLMAQLEHQKLLRPTFPPEDDGDDWPDPHLDARGRR